MVEGRDVHVVSDVEVSLDAIRHRLHFCRTSLELYRSDSTGSICCGFVVRTVVVVECEHINQSISHF